ncbi:RagB/SusD family nutrient uptake outer membrane protein [Prevotella sp. E2-28]|uniref:RagB/SusD family nutrient uptake outer membrane protein n=1 Tax=Prevotella sp. E2-28 TaxID=2913620 RepID=UPI001EDB4578|nr:RagB/SusD family nutrient uptake outer membrane protein [Prevotella sp. E2-28]UKK53616.1 RagB/SusD family nutrient uptake outer membrane protein [Prevotella sp. E2-28]
MIKIKKLTFALLHSCTPALLVFSMAVTSCNDFLDKLPDDRATVNTREKVGKLVTSAYPTVSTILISEISSDNVSDNGKKYGTLPQVDEMYRFKAVTTESNDCPRNIWNGYYDAVGTANEALQSINDMGNTADLQAYRGEALLCRAFSMFQMSTVFCMAYDPQKADQYLGLPYPLAPGELKERGTLAELYRQINDDIEEALPLIDDAAYAIEKYHFNTKAAYAFAARFNLYYQKWDKVIEYATKALGNTPSDCLRKREPYSTAAGVDDYFNMYVQSSQACNFLMGPAYSIAARVLTGGGYLRYAHNMTVLSYDTYWAYSPWNPSTATSGNTLLWSAHSLYGNNNFILEPKLEEVFEYTDKVNGIGYVHIVDPIFTGDETILCRAEAYIHKKEYAKALADMNTWGESNLEPSYGSSTRKPFTEESVNAFMNNIKYAAVHPASEFERSIKKRLSPQGFTVETGTQENMIQLILYMRRVNNMFQGLRFMDLKRYGIEYEHYLENEEALTFTAGDLRGAIQLPADVIAAGLQANPRTTAEVNTGSGQGDAQVENLNKPATSEIVREKID